MRKFILVFIFLYPAFLFSQQQQKIDSIQQLIKSLDQDTAKARQMAELAWEILSLDAEKAKEAANEAIAFSRKIKFKKGEADALHALAWVEYASGNALVSLEKNREALKIRESIGDSVGMGRSYINLGITYAYFDSTEKSMELYQKAEKIFLKTGSTIGLAASYNSIASIYSETGMMNEAIGYYFKAFALHEKTNNVHGLASVANNLGTIYRTLGDMDNAKSYFFKSLKFKEQSGNR